jgi:hypothetical protein
LRLLRHREGPWNGDLDPAVGDRTQELDVADLDRPRTADRADDPRNGVLVTRAIERDTGIVEVDAVEGGCEAIGIALPPHLAVGDDVDAGPLHVLDGEAGGVVLGLLEELLWNPPKLARPHPRRQPRSEPFPVDQPVGLRIAPDDGCRQRHAGDLTDST